jgi:hypothetical protein
MSEQLYHFSTWLLRRNEAITNLLDLLAFCLATPEIVGFARLQELVNMLRSGLLRIYKKTIEPVVAILLTVFTSMFVVVEIITFVAIPLAITYGLIVLVSSGGFKMPSVYNYLDVTEDVVIVLLLSTLGIAFALRWFITKLTEATNTGIMFVVGFALFVLARVLGFAHGLS